MLVNYGLKYTFEISSDLYIKARHCAPSGELLHALIAANFDVDLCDSPALASLPPQHGPQFSHSGAAIDHRASVGKL